MIKRPQKLKLNAEMNVVPYIDVMLVLLVIFMVTAPMLTQGIQNKNLPMGLAGGMLVFRGGLDLGKVIEESDLKELEAEKIK